MEKLPPTSYVRMVDIWLIFGQLIPFVEVILLTAMELYNTEDETNHHGFAVKIQPSIGEIEVTVKYKWVGWALLGIFQTLGNIDNLTR